MKKKIFVSLSTAVLMVLCLFPAVTLAADSTIDLKLYPDGSVINVGAGDTALIVDTAVPATTHRGIQIVCGAGANVTLQGVTIDNAFTFGVSPLSFTGGGNTLTLLSSSVNTLTGGMDAPAVRVESGTELTINGTGTLNAEGLGDAAGIGGGAGKDGGTISITDGTVTAKSGYSAGIGGGFEHNGGTVNISGGTVTAAANQGAGIGGGAGGTGGTVNISGGTVNATADQGAGIGGGEGGVGGAVNISGGSVTATGFGAGIGGGRGGEGGDVSITGGVVTAECNGMGFDIGSGQSFGPGGTLNADGAAGITLAGSGTNAAVTLGTCGITGAGAGSLAGVYISGERYTSGSVIDVSGSSSGTGYTYSSPVFTINEDREYLIWNVTAANRIVVAAGVSADIILFGTSIQPASGCAFDMTGATVDMTLMGSSVLKSSPGYNGLLCPSGATLTISGNGSLNVTASNNTSGVAGSGIGGNASTACGSITINSGTVTAKGGNARGGKIGLAGIGGAVVNITGGTVNAFSYRSGYAIGEKSNADSSITITGGTVNATAGVSSYGIGGKGSDPTDVTISGGNVAATGDSTFPAIGGSGGKLNISGGAVTAYSKFGAGIAVYSGTTTISGGTVYAASGDPTQSKDIGTPAGYEGTLNISGEAMVFLKNNSCNPPVTAHIHETFPAGTSEVYGAAITPPDTWTNGFGAYLKPYTLSFSANGGSGAAPDIKRLYNAKASLPGGSGFTRDNYTFKGWNTAADGSGKGYAAGDKFTVTADTALYAQWTAQPALTSSVADAKITTGGSIVLTPNIDGGTWNWDKTFFSASFNSPATFTALKPGTSSITYTVEGQTASYEVKIEQTAPVLTSSDADAKITAGGSIVLTPDISGGTWNWDNTFFSAAFSPAASFTALKPGTSVITYTVEGKTASYSVTIEQAAPVLTSSDADAKIYTGGRIVLTPDIGGGTWNWDNTFFSATFGQTATFTALKQGTSVITYTVGGQTVSYSVTIEKSDLPKTGQDSALIWALCALGLIAGAAAVLLKKRSKAGTRA